MRNLFKTRYLLLPKLVALFWFIFLVYQWLNASKRHLPLDIFIREIESKRVPVLSSNLKDTEDENIFYLNPVELCAKANSSGLLFLAFMVISPDKFEKRNVIRTTWANQTLFGKDFRMVFVIGMSHDDNINKMIELEYKLYKDILQLSFMDSYFKITSKVMAAFKWIPKHCSHVKYILRINDDAMVNTFALLNVFTHTITYKKRHIYGWLVRNYTTTVSRETSDKFYVARNQYALSMFPDYPSGNVSLSKPSTFFNILAI